MRSCLLVIAKEGYQDKELEGTRRGLEEGGFSLMLASTEIGPCTGKFGGTEEATIALRDVDVSAYDRIAFIGGPGAKALREDEDALRVAREACAKGMIVGAICIAPTILAAAGALKGKRATVWNEDGEQSGYIEGHGASYTGQPVTVDGTIVTGDGPASAEAFGKALAAA